MKIAPRQNIQFARDKFEWSVASSYEWQRVPFISNYVFNTLVPSADCEWRTYKPLAEPAVFRSFAEAEPSRAGVLRFVSRYGMPWTGPGYFPRIASSLTRLRLAVELWTASRASSRSGAVARLAKRIIEDIRLAEELQVPAHWPDVDDRHEHMALAAPLGYTLISHQDSTLISHQDSTSISHQDSTSISHQDSTSISHQDSISQIMAMQTPDDAINALGALMNSVPITHSVEVARMPLRQGFVMEILPAQLIDAMWLQFFEAVADDAEYRECAHCGSYMDSRKVRADAKYCSDLCRSLAYLKRKERLSRPRERQR